MDKHAPLYIRTDATRQTGTGHIMRCIALAHAWKRINGPVTFVSRCEMPGILERIARDGFSLLPVSSICPDTSDLEQLLALINTEELNHRATVILDGYHFTPEYQLAVRNAAGTLLIIDDQAHWPEYHAHYILNQTINAEHLSYHADEDTERLLGPRWCLLRPEFLAGENKQKIHPPVAGKILVMMGGVDFDNNTEIILRTVESMTFSNLHLKVVIGPGNQHVQSLQKMIERNALKIELIQDADNIPGLMQWADLAISAAGTTCWELARLGVPMIVLAVADNQIGIAESLQENNLAVSLGWYEDLPGERIRSALELLTYSQEQRQNMSNNGMMMIDGKGAERVAHLLAVDEGVLL